MLKIINSIIVFTLVLFAFFAGVKYSDSIKEHASWLFEIKEEELLDLPTEDSQEIGATIDETIENNNIIENEDTLESEDTLNNDEEIIEQDYSNETY